MKVGIIGLGDIARKAYLPVLTARRGLDPHLHTRSPETLERVADTHRVPAGNRHTALRSLIDVGLDAAFVHAPTETHPGIVRSLLAAGVPTYVDKPLAYELDDARELVRTASEQGVPLAVGFNRRFAPDYAQCADHPRDLVLMQKNRVGLPEDPRRMVYDDFIHVVDTLRFLAPGEVERAEVHGRLVDGLLHHVVLHLTGAGFTAIGTMNRRSGSAEEILEVSGGDSKREVRNLAEVVDHGGRPGVRRRGDWVPVARQRGIEQAALSFLDAVHDGTPVDAEDALRTHELCERVVTSVLAQAG